MASRKGSDADLWAEIETQGDDEQQPEEQEIAVVYGRRRRNRESVPKDQLGQSGRENRVSFVPSKRPSWNRSLSIRESIIVAVGDEFRPQPKQKGGRKIPKPGRGKKAVQEPTDFRKEKAYFQEVDSFELLEESPSPKQFSTWAMGRQHDYFVHDLPSILERWRISKLAYSCLPSQQLGRILETPTIPSVQSYNGLSGNLFEKTPERALKLMVPFNLSCYKSEIHSKFAGPESVGDLNESSIVSSFGALQIKEESIEGDFSVGGESRISSASGKELEGANRKESVVPHSTSLGGECYSAFAQLVMVCHQQAPLSLHKVFCNYCDSSSIVKIGEGTYGEAFKAGDAVCKVVPIDGDLLVNGEVQKKSEEVLEEVLLSLTLNNLRPREGETIKENSCTIFIETKDFRVCQGSYDASLIKSWEEWDMKHGSENDHPKEFSENQCYIVFILAHGGKDLESFVLLNFDEARSLLVQVTVALAVAEAACEFEHRDLHWGNILLTRSGANMLGFTIEGRKMQARTYGLTVSIIDFTLSRINTGKAILFLDLSADPGLFEGPKGDIQSETYRKMKKETKECWEGSFPKSNVLWLIYLVDILLIKKSFKRTTKDERELRSFKKRLNSYTSAKDSLSDAFLSELLSDHSP
ncbi:putative non-specific serine/threonine protein kinase [Dioscorea sansibarensis]